jgi:hypothetical protein
VHAHFLLPLVGSHHQVGRHHRRVPAQSFHAPCPAMSDPPPPPSLELLQEMGATFAPGSAPAAAAGLEVVSVVPFTALVELDALKARGGSGSGGASAGVAAAARAALRWLSDAMAAAAASGGAVRGESLQVGGAAARLWHQAGPAEGPSPGACRLAHSLGPSIAGAEPPL